jgi:hypothetical protein
MVLVHREGNSQMLSGSFSCTDNTDWIVLHPVSRGGQVAHGGVADIEFMGFLQN